MLVHRSNHRVGTQQESGLELNLLCQGVSLPRTCMTADCRDKDIKKTIQEAKYSWQYAGQEVLICTY